MTIDNLKDLEKIIRLCRKQGVITIKIDGIELTLGPAPQKTYKPIDIAKDIPEASIKVPVPNFVQGPVETEELSEEQMLMWSVTNEPN